MASASNAIEGWLFSDDPDRSWLARRGVRALRVLWLAGTGFIRDEGFHHASALAFDTVLALVPLIVIVVSILRGLGAYEAFVATTIEPFIETTFTKTPEDMVTLREAFLQVLELGEQADVRALGAIGVVVLLYLVVILLTTVESTLNRIWGVRRPRSWVRRAADYAAILFVMPLGLIMATAIGSGLGGMEWLGGARFVVREALAIGAATIVLTFLYVIMPYTRTRLVSAILGGLVAGALWHGGLVIYAMFQVGVARYNLLYSGFATLPLFLVWVFVSWLFVLFGAELAAAHQDVRAFRWRVREGEASPRTRHRLGVRFAAEITRAFLRGEPPPDLIELSEEAGVPTRLAEEVLDDLASHGIFLRATREGVPTYVLGRDPRSVRLSTVMAALDEIADPVVLGSSHRSDDAHRLAALVSNLESANATNPANLTLREMVDWLDADGVHRLTDPGPDTSRDAATPN